MTPSETIYAVRWLVRDTFRQALASRVFWIMLTVSAVCILFCLGVSVEGGESLRPTDEVILYGRDNRPLVGPNPQPGYLHLAFGAVKVELPRGRTPGAYGEAGVHLLQVILAKWVAGAVGLLLALLWTAGFLPEFLQASSAMVLLAKPVPRWALLVGKYLGVVLFVTFQAAVFFGGTWLALGLRTNVWLPGYLAGVPLLALHFAVVYSFSVLLAVCTRSTIACVFGAILFWLLCFGMNYGRHAVVALATLAPEARPLPDSFTTLTEVAYWVLPKPADLMIVLDQALASEEHFSTLPEFEVVRKTGALDAELSLFTSMLFTVGVLALASRQLSQTDY
jgi:hypothetical protein